MQKYNNMHYPKTALYYLLLFATVSCSEVEEIISGSDEGKEPISFAMSDDAARLSRGGFYGGETFIAMRMQSDNIKVADDKRYTLTTAHAAVDGTNDATSYSAVNFADAERRYWDDAHGQYSLLSVYAVAIPNMADDVMTLAGKLHAGSNTSAQWGRKSDNTLAWTVSAVQTKTDADYNKVPVTAASGSIDKEDLVYSNNIQATGKDGIYRWNFGSNKYVPDATGAIGAHDNGQMRFVWKEFDPNNPTQSPSAAVGKFDKGHLIFTHALSRVTVTLNSGKGFESSPFTFADGTTIKLKNMNVSGTLDLQTGTWSGVTKRKETMMGRKGSGTTAAGTFVGQILPGYVIANSSETAMMEFTIDGNTYYVTQDMLYDALYSKDTNRIASYGFDDTAGKFTMMQGKNYKFVFTVNKRQIEAVTASLVDWEPVKADDKSLTNARIQLQVEERGTKQISDVAIYKANDNKKTDGIDDGYTTWNWETGYANLSATYSSDHWTTSYFWETSKDFYHFRALMPAETSITTDAGVDYAILASARDYTDIRWGAPMLDDGINEDKGSFKWLYGPTSGGFDHADDGTVATDLPADTQHQIYKAIGATEDPVKLTLFHVMSDVTFNIKTTEGSDKVELCHDNGAGSYTHTRLDLVGFYNGGKVLLGTGLVKIDGTASTLALPATLGDPTVGGTDPYTAKTYHYGAVPQDLTAVKLYITTPDGNQYIIDLKDVKATTVSNNNLANPYEQGSDGKYTLDRWYPGFKYTYNITLKKAGITNLQATVVDWESVTADDETVQIK